MDNITHTFTGLMLARIGLDRWCPRATPILLLAANAPDIDVVAAFAGGPVTYLDHHRGPTHALAMAPVMAALAVAAVGLAVRGRNMRWLRAWVTATIGVVSHGLLDWTNIYGIRLWWPFDRGWPRLDITPVVDPWILALFTVMVLWPPLARLVGSEMGARLKAGRGIAWFALAALSTYEFGRWIAHERAMATLESRLYEGRAPVSVAAMPSFVHPLRWRGLVQLDDGYRIVPVDLARPFDPTSGRRYYQAEPGPDFEAAHRTRAFAVFRDFAPYPLWRVVKLPEPEGAVQVEGVDLRFGDPGEGRFMVGASIEQGRVTHSWFQFTPPGHLPRPK